MRPFLVAGLILAGSGCFGPRGHYSAEEHRVCVGDVCYHFGALPGWRVIRQKGGAIAFFNDQTNTVAQANATCRDDAEVASLEVLMRHLLIGYTEVHARSSERVWVADREALHDVYDARLDGVPVVLDLYVIKRNGCIFDLSLAAAPDDYDTERAAFTRFVAGFSEERKS